MPPKIMACQQLPQMLTAHIDVIIQKQINIPNGAGLPVIKVLRPPLWQADKDIVHLYVIWTLYFHKYL